MSKTLSILFIAVMVCASCSPAVINVTGDDSGNVDLVATALAQTQAAQSGGGQSQPQPTATTRPNPTAVTNSNANCRSGPDANFDLVVLAYEGTQVEIIGHNTQFGNWWQVRMPDGSECFIFNDSLNIGGDTSSVPLVQSPATPTPVPPPNWTGVWSTAHRSSFYTGGTVSWAYPNINITQTGNTITSTGFTMFGFNFWIEGTVSADGYNVTGVLHRTNDGAHWNIRFIMDPNRGQFRGNYSATVSATIDGEWCGWRNGYTRPEPCRK